MKQAIALLCLAVLLASCKFNDHTPTYEATLRVKDSVPSSALLTSIQRGSLVYEGFCISCHLAEGQGVEGSFPPLAGADYLLNNRNESIRAIKFGQQGEIVVNGKNYNGVMAPQGLDDDEVADVMNFILNSWGNSSSHMVTPEEVAAVNK